jgi:hypothetical protein
VDAACGTGNVRAKINDDLKEVDVVADDLRNLIRSGKLSIGTTLAHKGRQRSDRDVSATVVEGGLRLRGQVYATPSGAAKAVTRTPVNGWAFWRLPDGRHLYSLRPSTGPTDDDGG